MSEKYILCARGTLDVNNGPGTLLGGTPHDQTEAATELMIHRLAAIHLLQTNVISKDYTVVTLPERKFLYENIFDNVVDYAPGKFQYSIDVVRDVWYAKLPYKPFYGYYDRDKELINNIVYNNDILSKDIGDFLVCIPRLKRSDMIRNLDQEYWLSFVECVKDQFEKIIVFGKGNENFADGDRVIYVDTLQDFCSYIHHKNCKHVVSTISGPCHYVQQFGNTNKDTTLTMIDNGGMYKQHGHDPSFFHPCINFTKVKIKIIPDKVPAPERLRDILWD